MRAWAGAHPAGVAAVHAVVFGILVVAVDEVTSTHRSLGSEVVRVAIAAVIFGLFMWALNVRRRRTGRS